MAQFNRRETLVGGILGGSLLGASSMPLSANASTPPSSSAANGSAITAQLNSWLVDAPLFNRENAMAVLDRHGLDAILVSDHTSIYHFTGIRLAVDSMFAAPPESFALFCRDEKQPVRYLSLDFPYYYAGSDQRPGKWLETRIYTGPAFDGGAGPRDPFMLRVPANGTLTADEARRRKDITDIAAERAISAEAGLISMLRDAGLENATVAADSGAPSAYGAKAELNTKFVGGERALGEIRRIKSPIEIELMRHAASANARATTAAARVLRAGANHSDLRNAYFKEAVTEGGLAVFMAIDRATSPRYDRKLMDGQAFLIDGVSQYHGYHGDFGRTVFLGEPNRHMAGIVSQINEAWKAIRPKMVVGSTYQDLIAAGQEAIRKSGKDIMVAFNVHSVGLWHSDDPAQQSDADKLATKLQPGMILSVDCPLFDEGIGGSAHYEDLTLITEQGPVSLNEMSPPALMI